MSKSNGWIGVDLDGTLAEYHGWQGPDHVGAPIEGMMRRVRKWLEDGNTVKIMTARVSLEFQRDSCIKAIHEWLESHGLPRLEVTCIKDLNMIELWDDRAVQVIHNTGTAIVAPVDRHPDRAATAAARLEAMYEAFALVEGRDDKWKAEAVEALGKFIYQHSAMFDFDNAGQVDAERVAAEILQVTHG